MAQQAPSNIDPSSMMWPDIAAKQYQLQRAQSYAQMLQKGMLDAQSEPAGTMVSGHYVPTFGGAKSLAMALMARNADEDANSQQKALADALRTRNDQDLTDFMTAAKGEPAHTLPAEEMGPTSPGQAPDLVKAIRIGMNSANPMLQGASNTLFSQQFAPKLPKWEKAEMPDGKGGVTSGFVDVNSSNPWATFQKGGHQPAKLEYVNGRGVNPYTSEQSGVEIPKQAEPANPGKDLAIPDGKGGYVPNATVIEAKKAIQKAGAPNINNTISVAGPENKYNQDVGAGLAKESLDLVGLAKNAPMVVENARAIKTAIKNGAVTGTLADTRLAVQKAAETMGIVEPGKAATTQQLMSGLAKLTLGGVKTSGLGAGNGFTDKDREFLNAAISGQISDTPENLVRVADLSERVATATHQKGTKVLNRWKANPTLSNISQDYELDPIPAAPVAAPAARPPLSSFNKK